MRRRNVRGENGAARGDEARSSEASAGDTLAPDELRRRASRGIVAIGSWGLLNLFVGFGGTLVLARLLPPRDFGLVAVGATVVIFGTALCEGGLGSGLIRRPEAPTRAELRAVFALQLSITTILGAGVAATALAIGGAANVVALMMLTLPIAAIQTPGRVVIARAVLFRTLSRVDGIAMSISYIWAIAAVASGLGVWALASMVIVKAAVASAALPRASGLGLLRPSFADAASLKPMIAFGVRFQSVSFTGMIREQGLTSGMGLVAGLPTVGLWALGRRLLELPLLLFEPLWRVSFPVMSQVLAAKRDPVPLIQRGIAMSATVAGIALTGLAAAAPEMIPVVFGEQWRSVAIIVVWGCASFLVSGPISVALVGYLYAADAPGVVLRAAVLQTVTLFAVTFPLLPLIGVWAIGVGHLASSVVDAVVLTRGAQTRVAVRPLRVLAPPLSIAVAAAAVGIAVSSHAGDGAVAAVAGGGTAVTVYLAGLLVLRGTLLRETFEQLKRAILSARPEPVVPAQET